MKTNNLFTKVKRKLTGFYHSLLRAIISLHKRDNRLIVYGGALDLFIDNAKHLFIINNQALPDYRHVWLTKNEAVLHRIQDLGFEAALSESREGRRFLYEAGMVIYDNRIDEFANHLYSAGAIRFELWHGVTVAKRIGMIRSDPPVPYVSKSSFYERYIHEHIYGDYVLATSKSLSNTMSAAFQVPVDRVLVSDQPRSHTLFMNRQELHSFFDKYEDVKGKQLYKELMAETRNKIIYMPTFRDADPEYIYKAIPDWGAFNDYLVKNNIVFYLKVHRVTPLPQGLEYSNIRIMDNSLDIYPLLPLFNRLVTDYSSIMFEYALLKRPIIIYDYDLEEYISKSRYVFKDFINLLNDLTEAKNYLELLSLLVAPDSSIKPLPFNNYYDSPGNISALNDFIKRTLRFE